jgi:hypothetical protein
MIHDSIYKQVLFIAVLLFSFASCSSPEAEESGVINPEEPIPLKREEIILPDTSLLGENAKGWIAASKEKQLSNCAAVIYARLDTSEFVRNKDINEQSRLLHGCLHDVTAGMPTVHDDPIKQLIESCLNTLDFEAN